MRKRERSMAVGCESSSRVAAAAAEAATWRGFARGGREMHLWKAESMLHERLSILECLVLGKLGNMKGSSSSPSAAAEVAEVGVRA